MIFLKRIFIWILTLLLVALCLFAGRWQLSKGLKIAERNQQISLKEKLPPVVNPETIDPVTDQWRLLKLKGEFLSEYRLMKNQYQDGQFGFHVLQKFNSNTLGEILVDRGWVKAGMDARTAPVVPPVKLKEEEVTLRIRSEFLHTSLSGKFFALPVKTIKLKEVYFDQIAGDINSPLSAIDLPELSTGPHFAYAFQWFLFALLILIGKFIFDRKSNSKSN